VSNRLNALANHDENALERGIAALQRALGSEAAASLLQPAPKQRGEAASFYFPLPIDYTGQARRLRIGFPTNFPRGLLQLEVEPSPWLVWPHAMKSGLCLHGFQQRPITGSPEFVVQDSLARVASIVSLSCIDANKALRDAEFQKEVTSYWSMQLERAAQNIILLDRPQAASALFALSDPRNVVPSGRETVWLAAQLSVLERHYRRIVGRSAKVRAAQSPGFYVKLQSHPDLRMPAPAHLLPWLVPHLAPADAEMLLSWFHERGSLTNRWIALALPGENDASIYCLNVRSYNAQPERGARFNLRTLRRQPATAVSDAPKQIRATTLDVLDRTAILSRDQSGATHALEHARVVCIGAGSLGSSVALQLARAGVGHLTIIDYDKLEAANLGRHVLGADDLGRMKAEALRDKIRQDLPTIDVTSHSTFAEWVMFRCPDVFTRADLVIITTADWLSEATFWRAKSEGSAWGLLQAWSEPHTQVGHALFAPTGAFDAQYLFRENGDFKHKFTDWPDGGIVALPGCGESFIPGGAIGMMNIALMVSQTALRVLRGALERTTWVSSIDRPQDIMALGGAYLGPALPAGMQQVQLEREWPEMETLS